MLFQLLQAGIDSTANAAAAAAATVPQVAQTEQTYSLIEMACKGGWLMIVLLILSIIAIYIFGKKWWLISRASKNGWAPVFNFSRRTDPRLFHLGGEETNRIEVANGARYPGRVSATTPVQFSVKVADPGVIDATSGTTRVRWTWTDGPADDRFTQSQITTVDYAENIRQVEQFLAGRRGEIIGELKEQMAEAAANLEFERAGRLKRRIEVISGLDDRQQVTFPTSVNIDLIGIYREETISCACVFVVREGRTIRTSEFILNKGMDVDEDELVEGFVKRYYDETADIPAEVDVTVDLPDAELLGEWLSEKRGHVCHLHRPMRGEKSHLLELASRNARHALMRYMVRTGYADDRTNQALLQLESALALDAPPLRIECFDISTLHGAFTVASMVVFTNGRPDKSQYRRFKIRTELDEANDFVSMQEVLGRRYSPERMADERFAATAPDLLVVDGGKPQLTAAMTQLAELGLDIPVCGLAKSDEEVFVPWDETPVVLPSGSASLYLIKQVRDESHRFAITFHRELRTKAQSVSILDEVEGVGPKRRKAIMRHFGSLKRLRAATPEQIAEVKGVPEQVARARLGGRGGGGRREGRRRRGPGRCERLTCEPSRRPRAWGKLWGEPRAARPGRPQKRRRESAWAHLSRTTSPTTTGTSSTSASAPSSASTTSRAPRSSSPSPSTSATSSARSSPA